MLLNLEEKLMMEVLINNELNLLYPQYHPLYHQHEHLVE
jgi:hypothetical protein